MTELSRIKTVVIVFCAIFLFLGLWGGLGIGRMLAETTTTTVMETKTVYKPVGVEWSTITAYYPVTRTVAKTTVTEPGWTVTETVYEPVLFPFQDGWKITAVDMKNLRIVLLYLYNDSQGGC